MTRSVVERENQWTEFLNRWPLEKLAEMTLAQYTEAGNQDCFVYWLEARTEILGSIWGGSAFKFGVYSRKDTTPKPNLSDRSADRSYGDEYAWYTKYGKSPEEAFAVVKSVISSVANAARTGQLALIDDADLGQSFKWKIAFLYQDRTSPCVMPIYKTEFLRAALESSEKRASVLHQQLLAKRPPQDPQIADEKSIFAYVDAIWPGIQARIKTELTPDAAKDFFEQSEQFVQIKPATKKMAGYQTANNLQIALALDNQKTTLYLRAGDWLASVQHRLLDIVSYAPDKSRSSNIAANAPFLSVGHAITKVVVPDMDALIALCDAYDDISEPPFPPVHSCAMTPTIQPRPPLNQILFGPPGTGKTHSTIEASLEVLAPDFLAAHHTDRSALKARFDELVAAGHIRFVTFHQSFSYEDFVEGLRAENDEKGQLRYKVADGIFKMLCDAAAAKVTKQEVAPVDISGRRVWKMSLGNSLGDDAYIFEECVENGYALLGYGAQQDFTRCTTRQQIQEQLAANGHPVDSDAYELTAVNTFVNKMAIGDLIVVTEGNLKFRAIGEISGDYRLLNREEQGDTYGQSRHVKWLRVYKPSLPHDQLMISQFSQMTIYELKPSAIDMEKLASLLQTQVSLEATNPVSSPFVVGEQFGSAYVVVKATNDLLELKKPNEKSLPLGMSLLQTLANYVRAGLLSLDDIRDKHVFEKVPDTLLEPYLVNGYNSILPHLVDRLVKSNSTRVKTTSSERVSVDAKVLIIDEINRGNVSRIFGELITLIEPSKRAGNPEALEVMLPYSKDRLSVPANLFLIGTMNTADRSLAGLDIALRRRFTFREMPPRPELLSDVDIQGVNVGQLLKVMNERIEVLLDRDHCLGHAYFMPLLEEPTLEKLASIFRSNVLPLVQEYFFEDWQRIQWVLNDHRKPQAIRFVFRQNLNIQTLFGDGVNVSDQGGIWKVNDAAFGKIESYLGILFSQQENEAE